jgi:hypothetical protein
VTADEQQDLAFLARQVDVICRTVRPDLRPLLVPAIALTRLYTWDARGRCTQGAICPRRQSYGHTCSCSIRKLEKWSREVGLAAAVQAEMDRILTESHADTTAAAV